MSMKRPTLIGLAVVTLLVAGDGCAWWGRDVVQKVARLHGKSFAAVLKELGRPDYEDEFPMSQAYGEFRVELYNYYPREVPGNADVHIKELHWDYRRYHIAVWFHKVDGEWRVLDTCRWQEGVEF